MTSRAIFLDRDGVLIADAGLLVDAARIDVQPGVPEALDALSDAGYALVVVTNQTVVARGLITEHELEGIHAALRARLPRLDGIYVCPHHPHATVRGYRVDCECRKPRPGLLIRAAADLHLDLGASVVVGDRPSDIAAGWLAGCMTVLVRSGAHEAPPIQTTLVLNEPVEPDHICAGLPDAAHWILSQR